MTGLKLPVRETDGLNDKWLSRCKGMICAEAERHGITIYPEDIMYSAQWGFMIDFTDYMEWIEMMTDA